MTARDVSNLATTDIYKVCTLDDGTSVSPRYAEEIAGYFACKGCTFKDNCECDFPCHPANRPDNSHVVFVRV